MAASRSRSGAPEGEARGFSPRARGAIACLGEHWSLVVVLGLGLAARLLMMRAYPPALFFNDSWGYLFTAFTGHPVALSYLHPNGYPVLIHLVTLPGRSLVRLVAFQHLSGLGTGALIYAALVRAGTPRLPAAIAAALVLLDGYAIVVEQYLMPEAFFTLTLLAAALIVAWPALRRPASGSQPRTWSVALAGFLLAAATVQREAAVFAAPVFAVYLLWTGLRARALIAFVAALALPLLAYAALYDARLGVFGLSETTGWTMYGRVAGIADCGRDGIPRSQRPLCETARRRASHPDSPTYYIWAGASPAGRMFPGAHQTRQAQERSDAVLGSFSRRVIVNQPLDYAHLVGADFLRYFVPGAAPFNDAVSATSLPSDAAAEPRNERDRRRVIPGVRPAVRSPAGLLRSYRRLVHVPRPLLALLAIASLTALALRTPSRRNVFLLAGSGLALLLGTAATAGFGLRYLLPAVPLLAIGGTLAICDLATWRPGLMRSGVTTHRDATPPGHAAR